MPAMDIEDFNYNLPKELIAQEPPPSREDSRMMVLVRETGEIRHDRFRCLPEYLVQGDALVINDSRVIPARLLGKDLRGRDVEVLLVAERDQGAWEALVRPSRRVDVGCEIIVSPGEMGVRVVERLEGSKRLVRIEPDGAILKLLERFGHVPLPPYIRRPDRPGDRDRYQTLFAREPGSVAAPTAGLHFGPDVLQVLETKGIEIIPVTLHVGPGTFRPIREKDPSMHTMDAEYYCLTATTAERLNRVRGKKGRIVAVGTTAARTLETAVDGVGAFRKSEGWTDLFIYPPYTFRGLDSLLTNFHLPKSTLLMLVAAFAGRELILDAYREAIREKYRFYSYGDVMLIR